APFAVIHWTMAVLPSLTTASYITVSPEAEYPAVEERTQVLWIKILVALSQGSQALLQAKREHTQPSASLTADISSSGSIGFSKSAALRRSAAKRRSSVTSRPVTNRAGVAMPLTRS